MKDWHKSNIIRGTLFSYGTFLIFLFGGSMYSTVEYVFKDNKVALDIIQIWKDDVANAMGLLAMSGGASAVILDRVSKGDIYTPKGMKGPTKSNK